MSGPIDRKVQAPAFPQPFYPAPPDRIPPVPASRQAWLNILWLLVCFGFASAWCLTAARELGATFDEPTYVRFGLEHWRSGNCRGLMKLGTMPLPVDVATLPLYLAERWRGTPFNPADDLDDLLPWARATNLSFLGLLLIYGWRVGRSLGGPWAGRLAVAFLACEPTILAHAGLATTDIAVTACLLALLYHYRTSRDAGWFHRLAVPAFWFAAAVLSKASAIVFGPLCLLVLGPLSLVLCRFKGQGTRDKGQGTMKDLLIILGGGLVLVSLYCGSSDGPAKARLLARLPEGPMRSIAEHVPLFNNAIDAVWFQVRHNAGGDNGTFLLGHWHAGRTLWYYFPVALAIKLSLPLLLLPLVIGLARPRALITWPCLAAGALLLFSLTCRVQIGVRYMLPLIALAVVGLAAACASSGRWFRLAAVLAVLWTATSALTVWPNGLCYANEFWGGTENAYLCLSDSNYDWGQGVKELHRWQSRENIPRLDVWYFGNDPALRRLPMRWLHLEQMPVREPGGMLDLLHGRHLAVSTTVLHGHPCSDSPAAAFLRSCRPVARTSTFLIYRFP